MPELSIVIPTRNRVGRLRACLESLSRQTVPRAAVELVVVDDGSRAETREMITALQLPIPLRLVRCEGVGAGPARNAGAREALAPLCLFLDDDVVAAEGLIAAHLAAHEAREDIIVVLGRIDRALVRGAGRFARYRHREWVDHFEGLAKGRVPTFRDCYGANLSVSRTVLLEVGGFPSLPVENDLDLGYRFARRGLDFVYVDDARVTEDHREALREVVADAEARGGVSLMLYEQYPEILPELELGGRGELGGKWLALRRACLVMRLPPTLVAALLALLPAGDRMRLAYRFLFSYCYWRGVRSAVPDRDTWRRISRGVLILLYHAVDESGAHPSRFVIPLRRFERQMKWLVRRGYRAISLDELLRLRRKNVLPAPRSIVVTFDDGYVDNTALAAPLLERLGIPATIFLVSGTDGRSSWNVREPLMGRRLLTLSEATTARSRLLGFGAHTRTHPRLTEVDSTALGSEVAGSKSDLEEAFGEEVIGFAYPYGRHDERVRAEVARAGFLGACTVEEGRNRPATDDYLLRRVEIYGTDSLLRFALSVWLGSAERPFSRRKGRR